MWKIGTPVIARRKPEYDDRYVRAGVMMRVQEDGRRGFVVDASSVSGTFCMLRDGVRSWWEVDELHFDKAGFLERLAAMLPEGARLTGDLVVRLPGCTDTIDLTFTVTDEKAGV